MNILRPVFHGAKVGGVECKFFTSSFFSVTSMPVAGALEKESREGGFDPGDMDTVYFVCSKFLRSKVFPSAYVCILL